MRDIFYNNIQEGDFIILAGKASVSHTIKLGLVTKVCLDKEKIYFLSLENDWRGIKRSKRNSWLSLKDTNSRISVINRNTIPTNLINYLEEPLPTMEFTIYNNCDFFNQELTIGEMYLVAKHKNDSSILETGILDTISEDNKTLIFKKEHDNGEFSFFKTKRNDRILKI